MEIDGDRLVFFNHYYWDLYGIIKSNHHMLVEHYRKYFNHVAYHFNSSSPSFLCGFTDRMLSTPHNTHTQKKKKRKRKRKTDDDHSIM